MTLSYRFERILPMLSVMHSELHFALVVEADCRKGPLRS